ncbi:unnamed protein product [Miscanthus lutarioriparius]|uniref:Uncharacterized protein n=1 Tax=Miscanthus lutarioriparius TaxID=422564 RepID=A0A811RL97_9POAL|nr:unnamed protein product [Miscanthus lutarioriparius]
MAWRLRLRTEGKNNHVATWCIQKISVEDRRCGITSQTFDHLKTTEALSDSVNQLSGWNNKKCIPAAEAAPPGEQAAGRHVLGLAAAVPLGQAVLSCTIVVSNRHRCRD